MDNHPPFAGRDILDRMKGKNRDLPEPARMNTLIPGSHGMGGIFNDREPMLRGYVQDLIHVRRGTGKMNRDNGLRLAGNFFFNQVGINVQSIVIDIHKNRLGAQHGNHIDRRGKGHGRGDDFIARTDAQSQQN